MDANEVSAASLQPLYALAAGFGNKCAMELVKAANLDKNGAIDAKELLAVLQVGRSAPVLPAVVNGPSSCSRPPLPLLEEPRRFAHRGARSCRNKVRTRQPNHEDFF